MSDVSIPSQLQAIESLVERLEHVADEETRSTASELVAAVMELHREGLQRLIGVVTNQAGLSDPVWRPLIEDDLVSALLLLHGLHPVDLRTRLLEALERVRPYLHSHGGDVELMGIDDGIVRLRLQGSCHGCPSSQVTLKTAIEEAILAAAPDIAGLEVEGVVDAPPTFIPAEALQLGSAEMRSSALPILS